MTTGLRNEVYAARVGGRDVVVRMNHDPAPLRGSAESSNRPGDMDPLTVARDRAVIAEMIGRLSPGL